LRYEDNVDNYTAGFIHQLWITGGRTFGFEKGMIPVQVAAVIGTSNIKDHR
jgi:hypothetical protein